MPEQHTHADVKPVTPVAAIDVGSNGIRLLIAQIDNLGNITPIDQHRLAIRLGQDAFEIGHFRPNTIQKVVQAFCALRDQLKTHHVKQSLAVATSASRKASNAEAMYDQVRQASGIHVKIIDAVEEMALVHQAVRSALSLTRQPILLLDVGAGSVELAVCDQGKVLDCMSLEVGPVKLLQQLKEHQLPETEVLQIIGVHQQLVAKMISRKLTKGQHVVCVAVGGNVESLSKLRVKMLHQPDDRVLPLSDMKMMLDTLMQQTPPQRQQTYGLSADRADVIVLAGYVVQKLLEETEIEQLLIPAVGLKEGLLIQLADHVLSA